MMNKMLMFALLVFISYAASPPDKETIILSVLAKNKIGKTFVFNLSDNNNYKNQAIVTYLGEVQTTTKETFHILTWGSVWGPNQHTTGTILLYDEKKQYVGKYILGAISDLPLELDKNDLLFFNTHKTDCDQSLVSRINFSTVPQSIFIKCTEDLGDVYNLSLDSL